jgi:hypothetical protein
MPAHAIGDGPQAALRSIKTGIFIDIAHPANV